MSIALPSYPGPDTNPCAPVTEAWWVTGNADKFLGILLFVCLYFTERKTDLILAKLFFYAHCIQMFSLFGGARSGAKKVYKSKCGPLSVYNRKSKKCVRVSGPRVFPQACRYGWAVNPMTGRCKKRNTKRKSAKKSRKSKAKPIGGRRRMF